MGPVLTSFLEHFGHPVGVTDSTPYQSVFPLIERQLWSGDGGDDLLARYQALFREMESLPEVLADTGRQRFVVVIPVADRPRHLRACLDSLLELCRRYHYGGVVDGVFHKVSVLIADDSLSPDNIAENQSIAGEFDDLGLSARYFGLDEQWDLLGRLPDERRNALAPIISDLARADFAHKGASLMRNIAYLTLDEMAGEGGNTLFWFVDSDQEFQVGGDRFAINYFYQLERIFRQTDAEMLTGKVVGDPPVSPSVMAGNFLDDVIGYLNELKTLAPEQACTFHNTGTRAADDAAYHDMADLFGFDTAGRIFRYPCPLDGEHDHEACFRGFAAALNRFFDGEHPTRKTAYEHQELDESVKPARTVYTGNYLLKPSALRYFIPFAGLKLRMAGPVLGRIVKAEIGDGFVSANLPMLHRRTVETIGRSEFRPGIGREDQAVDLSGEFERQFFGDVMLFSMEKLTAEGYPIREVEEGMLEEIVRDTSAEMLEKYMIKQGNIKRKLAVLSDVFNEPSCWWQQSRELAPARDLFLRFLDNMAGNFSEHSAAYLRIQSVAYREERLGEIRRAIRGYGRDRVAWESVLRSCR